jgi:sorting nexin-9/18/33
MATLPRTTKPSTLFTRPQSEFDAGINASTAWTEHLERESISLSDEEPDNDADSAETHRQARALYRFEGKAEFRELSVEAGDDLDVVKEDLADGWSLVKNYMGEVGLLPRTYYTVGGCHSALTARLMGSGLWYIVHIRFYSSPRPGSPAHKQTLAV